MSALKISSRLGEILLHGEMCRALIHSELNLGKLMVKIITDTPKTHKILYYVMGAKKV